MQTIEYLRYKRGKISKAQTRLGCAVFIGLEMFNRKLINGIPYSTVNQFTRQLFYGKMEETNNKESPLVALRTKAGLTQEALAAELGVTDHTVRNWEKGRAEARLSLKQFKRLCELLGLSLASELPDSFMPIKNTQD